VGSENGGMTTHQFEGSPFEFVRLKFTDDFQFVNFSTGQKINAGEELIVPACWAYWIIDRQGSIENWAAVRVIINVAAAVLSAITLEPGPLLFAEFIANGSDIVLTVIEDEILSSGSSEAQLLYSKLEMLVTTLDVSMISVSIYNGVKSYAFNRSKLKNDITSRLNNSNVYEEFKNGVRDVVSAMRNTSSEAFSQGQEIFNSFWESAFKQIKVQEHSQLINDWENLAISVDQGNKLFVKSDALTQYQVAEVLEDGIDDVILKDLRWIDNAPLADLELIHVFENIKFQKSGSSVVYNSDLQIVRLLSNGEIFVREVEDLGDEVMTYLNTLFSKSVSQNFLNDLIVFAGSNQNRLARYGSESALKNKLIYFFNHSSVINVKPYNQIIQDIENFFTISRSPSGSLIPGALEYFDELLQAPQKFKGGAFGLEILANPPPFLVGKKLVRLEAGIDDTEKFRFDMLFEDGNGVKIFVETKNYGSTTSFSTSFYNQFKAYISSQEITDISQIKYYFRLNSGITREGQIQKFKNMLLNGDRFEEIYDLNMSLMNSLQILNKNQFKLLMESNNTSHPFFNFIEIY
ncbi:MAG: hypothetical protein JNJ99_07280, partial [Crocinitomicaceae bacterium]|nr:hypothetical protein [Crocinitomicaceae bacterium]